MVDYIDKGCEDGTVLGQDTTSLVGFWGVTPVVQAAALSAAATALTVVSASASLSTTIHMTVGASTWGFTNTNEAQCFLKAIQNLQIRQKEVETALVNCGLIAGGTQVPDETIVEYIGNGNDDGDILGQDTAELVGFWGTAPVDQPSAFTAAVTVTAMPIVVVTVTASQIAAASGAIGIMIQESATAYGFDTFNAGSTFLQVVKGLESRLAEINTRLVEIGVIAGGTALTAATGYDYLDANKDDGAVFGKATDKLIGFWGTTATAQQAALTTAALTIIASIYATATDNAIAALISTTDAFHVNGITAAQTMLDAVRRLQIRMGEIEAAMETPGLCADDGVS
jgi:hypothetical protein